MTKAITCPLVSLIVPTYNAIDYIGALLDDIAAQTYRNVEVIVIDDGSTDGAPETVGYFAVTNPHVRLLKQPHASVSSARNLGLRECRGELIGFLDSDDRVEPAYIESLVRALDSGSKMSVCGWDRGVDTPVHISVCGKDVVNPAHLMLEDQAFFTSLWNKLFSREIIFRNGSFEPFDETLAVGEDEEWLSRVLLRCPSCTIVSKPLYHWLEHAGSATPAYLSLDSRTLTEVDAKRRVYHRFSLESELATLSHMRYVYCMRDLLVANYDLDNSSASYSSLLHEYFKATEKLRGGVLASSNPES